MDEPFASRLTTSVISELFPNSDSVPKIEGSPPVATVTQEGKTIGYLFSTHETVHPTGYAGHSFDIVVALDVNGVIRGHRMLEHHEPLIGRYKLSGEHLDRFLSQLHGINLKTAHRFRPANYDGVSRATVSAEAMRRATTASAITVGELKGLIAADQSGLWLDRYSFAEHTWPELVAEGAIQSISLSSRVVQKELSKRGVAASVLEQNVAPDDTPFITLHTALVTPPAIGRNLFGYKVFRQISRDIESGEHQLMIASSGKYSWLPPNPWQVDVFDRVHLVQNETVIALKSEHFYAVYRLAIDGAPSLHQAGWFRIPAESGFDPLQEWSVELRVFAGDSHEERENFANFSLPYRIPPQYVIGGAMELEDAGLKEPSYIGFGNWRESTLSDWQRTWIDKQWSILGLVALLLATTAIMLFQPVLAHSRRLHWTVRMGLLTVTFVWLGWISGAQLTILSVINYITLAIRGADWHVVLFDPLLVILTGYVLVSLVLWGRGLFCGWLCPFGALQELLAKVGSLTRLPQISVRHSLQKQAWVIKYVIAVGIIGLALYSPIWASKAAEIEPFKTAISLHFERAWPYVLYASLLLGLGLFIERFYCRYLCPLGAVLALAGRYHLSNRLRRRPECGSPCHLCEHSCPIGAIPPTGVINMNECLQCLDCQVEYYDHQRCPPLMLQYKRRDDLASSSLIS